MLRPTWTILARDNVPRLSSTASCDTPCLSTGQGQRGGEGQSKVGGTSLGPPSTLRCHCLPVDKARPIIFTFLSRQLGPFCSFSMPRLRARFIPSFLPSFPPPTRMSLPPKPRQDISRGGNCRWIRELRVSNFREYCLDYQ